jgi:CDP-diacylglycerol---glycerol-3-phosphate 3-phosphatidyltransferase
MILMMSTQEIIKMNVPTLLTYLRIFLIPAIVLAFYMVPGSFGHLLAAIIFAFASLTDWFDGYLARNLNQTTKFGAFLDPVADKLIITVALILVVAEIGSAYIVIPAAVIIGREIVISSLREWMADIGKKTSIAVCRIAKIKTTLQMVAVGLLLLYHPAYWRGILVCGIVLLYLAVVLTLWSMFMYLRAAWPDLKENQR